MKRARAPSSRSRNLRPRATADLAVKPVTVTDLTSAIVLGLEPRQFRELVASAKVPHTRLGHRVVCRVEDVLAALERLRGDSPSAANADDDGDVDVDDILQLVGRRAS